MSLVIRVRSGHAADHWHNTQHCYSLELETQRVWDYAGDGYVHRLIQSLVDGKLVEVPSPQPAACSRNARSTGEIWLVELWDTAMRGFLNCLDVDGKLVEVPSPQPACSRNARSRGKVKCNGPVCNPNLHTRTLACTEPAQVTL